MPDLRRKVVCESRVFRVTSAAREFYVRFVVRPVFTSELFVRVKLLLSRVFGLNSTKNTLQKYNNYSLIAIKHILEWINFCWWILVHSADTQVIRNM